MFPRITSLLRLTRFPWIASMILASLLIPGVAAGAPTPNQPLSTSAVSALTIDDRFSEVGRRAPSFGGVFVDDDTLYVYLTDASPSASPVVATTQALRDVLGPQLVARSKVQVLPATYSFVQLKAWFDRMTDVLAMPGVVLIDIDDRQNRLRIGVADSSTQSQVEAALTSIGIPLAAVNFDQTGPVELAASLDDEIRPFVGGLRIVSSGLKGCTLGYSAKIGATNGWVTNAHCTSTPGQVDGTNFYQPGGLFQFLPSQWIGTETVDPAYGALPGCPATYTCRTSDSAFIQTSPGVSQTLGAIARPTTLGSTTWTIGNVFDLTTVADPIVGDNVTKVGKETGRTQGIVAYVGITLNKGNNLALVNQAVMTMASDNGDSGSPVVKALLPDGPGNHRQTTLAGLFWGRQAVNGVPYSLMSPQSSVQNELGLTKVCPVGFAC